MCSGKFVALAPGLYELSGHHYTGKDASRCIDHQGSALLEVVIGQVHDSVALVAALPNQIVGAHLSLGH